MRCETRNADDKYNEALWKAFKDQVLHLPHTDWMIINY